MSNQDISKKMTYQQFKKKKKLLKTKKNCTFNDQKFGGKMQKDSSKIEPYGEK